MPNTREENLILRMRGVKQTAKELRAAPGDINGKTLHKDHDHTTGEFRGWLCYKCNTGVAALGDNVVGLERAIAYFKKGAPICEAH
jgi:hypothetical protein